MRKFFVLFALVSASSAVLAQSQPPPGPAPAKTPEPVLSAEVTDSRIRALFDAGREALLARRYDDAIRLADEGIASAADQPAFWLNKAAALGGRATATYNRAHAAADEAEKKAGRESAARDYRAALAAATRGLALINATTPPADEALLTSFESGRRWALWLRAAALFSCAERVDESYKFDALTAIREYASAEIDPGMRTQAHLMAAEMMIRTHASDQAVVEFRQVLDDDPGNLLALLGEGAALVNVGYSTNDEGRTKEGLEYLRQFVEKAPERHPARASAAEALEFLKQNAPFGVSKGEVTPAPETRSPLKVEGGVINGRAISKPQPPYPNIGRAAMAQGPVVVRVVVNEQGDVVSTRAVSGHPLLLAPAVAAAREWKFSPTTLGGRLAQVSGTITYNFVMDY